MAKMEKYLVLGAIIAIFTLTISLVSASSSEASTLPATSFTIFLHSQEEFNLTSGNPFTIGIFSYDSTGTVTKGFNGNLSLTVTEGSISPSIVTLNSGFWSGQVIVNASGKVIITAQDTMGHTGSSHTLNFYAPSQTPTPSPSVPEFPFPAVLCLLVAVPLVATLTIRKRKKHS